MKRILFCASLLLSACGGGDDSAPTPELDNNLTPMVSPESDNSSQPELGLHSQASREQVAWQQTETTELVKRLNEQAFSSFQPEYFKLMHFSMLMQATQASSAIELLNFLSLSDDHLAMDQAQFWRVLNSLNGALNRTTGFDGEALFWGQHDYGFNGAYINNVVADFGVSLSNLDFAGDKASASITQQLNKKLNCCFDNTFSFAIEWNRLTIASIANLILDWGSVFSAKSEQQAFYLSGDKTKLVKMMSQMTELDYYQNDEITLVRPITPDSDWQVYFLMPHQRDVFFNNEPESNIRSYEKIKQDFSQDYFDAIKAELTTAVVELTMPPTEFEIGINYLKGGLLPLLASETDADFSGLNVDSLDDLYLSQAYGSVRGQLNEQGLYLSSFYNSILALKSEYREPSAGVVISSPNLDISLTQIPQPVSITFDRPFMFFIEHKPSKMILHLGEITSPEQMEPE